MSISPSCNSCQQELTEPGALVFSPPDENITTKFHLCVSCWEHHFVVIGDEVWTIEHPFVCRLSGRMSECEFHQRFAAWADTTERMLPEGRWRIRGFMMTDNEPMIVT